MTYYKQINPTLTVRVKPEFTLRLIEARLDGVWRFVAQARQTAQGYSFRGNLYNRIGDIVDFLLDDLLVKQHHHETLSLGDDSLDNFSKKDLDLTLRVYGLPEPGVYVAHNGTLLEMVRVTAKNVVFFRHIPRPGIPSGSGTKAMNLSRWLCITANERYISRLPDGSKDYNNYKPGDVLDANGLTVLAVTSNHYITGTLKNWSSVQGRGEVIFDDARINDEHRIAVGDLYKKEAFVAFTWYKVGVSEYAATVVPPIPTPSSM